MVRAPRVTALNYEKSTDSSYDKRNLEVVPFIRTHLDLPRVWSVGVKSETIRKDSCELDIRKVALLFGFDRRQTTWAGRGSAVAVG